MGTGNHRPEPGAAELCGNRPGRPTDVDGQVA